MLSSIEKLSRTSRFQLETDVLKRGLHIFDFQPKQLQLADHVDIFTRTDKKKIAIYGGAMGGGKTYVCLGLFIELALLYPGSIWTVVRESRRRCEDTVVIDFKKMAKGLYKEFNAQKLIATFHNGSRIDFKGENIDKDPDLDSFKSYGTNGVFIEQLEEVQKKMLQMALLRVGRNIIDPMPPQILLASINPSITWVKDDIYKPAMDGTLPKDIKYIVAKLPDNKYLFQDPAYMSTFDNLDDITKKRYLDGDWSSFAIDKPWAYTFSESNISPQIALNPNLTVYLSFDFNINPMTCTVHQFGPGWYYTLREFRIRNAGTEELCKQILGSEIGHCHFMVTGDPSGMARKTVAGAHTNDFKIIKDVLRLTDGQMKLPSTKYKSLSESRTLTNSIFSRHPDRKIHPNCEYLVKDLQFVEGKPNDHLDKSDPDMGHLLDTQRYMDSAFFYDFIK